MPASVDAGVVDWLKNGALFVTSVPAGAAAWAGKGVESEIVSPIVARAAAVTEADRQSAFLSGPNVKDRVLVLGWRKDLYGKPITIKGDRLGYTPAGVVAFVLGVEEQDNGTTVLTVLRRLAP